MIVQINYHEQKTVISFFKKNVPVKADLQRLVCQMAESYGYDPSMIISTLFDDFFDGLTDGVKYGIEVGNKPETNKRFLRWGMNINQQAVK